VFRGGKLIIIVSSCLFFRGGGECDLTNLQTLCVPCHAAKTKRQVRIWPLHVILLLRVVCARINRSVGPHPHLHCPHCYNTIARLLGNTGPPLDLSFVCPAPYNIGNKNLVSTPSEDAYISGYLAFARDSFVYSGIVH